MAAKKKTPEETTPEEGEEDNLKNKVRSVYTDQARWDKLKLIRDELGSWNKFADIAIEQLLASGLISKETQEAIKKINQEYGLDFLEDIDWRRSFEIREPWGETASHIRRIDEGVDALNANLKDLAQAVEDHAMAMLAGELVKPDDED